MTEVLAKAFCFIFMIGLGYMMKKLRIFDKKDHMILSGLSMYITLPAVLITSFQHFQANTGLILIIGLGIVMNIFMMLAGWAASLKKDGRTQALYMLNCSSYNIGSFVIPFVSGFYPAMYVIYSSMFDIGNCITCTGATYACASSRIQGSTGLNGRDFLKRLFSSVPFDTYVIMLAVSLLGIHLPSQVYTVSSMIGSANTFLVMFMLGLIIEFQIAKEDIREIAAVILIRYGLTAVIAAVVWILLPVEALVKQVLVITLFAPISSIIPAFCAKCGCKASVYGTLNSVCMPLSILIITVLLMIWS